MASSRTLKTKWYVFQQNNSGGRFKAPAIKVYVEGVDANHANLRAKELDIYFDGEGDCSCCGTRWDAASEGEYYTVAEEPMEEVLRYPGWGTEKVPEAIKYRIGENAAISLPVRYIK